MDPGISSSASSRRLFVAVDLPEKVRQELTQFQDRLKTACRFVDAHPKWVDPQNLHITLLFLGYVPAKRIDDVIQAVDYSAREQKAFDLRLQGVDLFPPGKRDRKVLATDVNGGVGKLEKLNRSLIEYSQTAGIPIEDKRFLPHLTLARLTSIKMISRFSPIAESHKKLLSASFAVSEIVLFESILEPAGPRYFPLHRVPLMVAENNLPG